jgi:cell division protein FtsQ
MNRKLIIRKVLTALFWLITCTGIVTLLVAANRPEQGHTVREVRITIKGDGEQFFIDKSDILLQLTVAGKSTLVGKPLDRLRLDRLERSLERGVWIREAELWIDSRDVLHVQVTEREPVARIFTTTGESFYIDSSGKHMPLLEKESARVLVVTNYPGSAHYSHKDSLRVAEVRLLAITINADPFWKEQLAQLDITPSGSYEAIPLVGNHLIRIGDAEDLSAKLARLKTFYKQVLAKTGLDRYAVVDIQYAGQVVGIYRGAVSAVDSLQLQQNIEALLARAQQQMQQDSVSAVQASLAADTARTRSRLPLDSIATQPEPADNSPAPVQHLPDTTHRANTQPAAMPSRATRPPAHGPKPQPRAVLQPNSTRRNAVPHRTTNEY